jgi:predicted nucleotidyltransferase
VRLNGMRLDEIKEKLAKHKEDLRLRFKVKELGIFGSYVKEEQKEGSDLDVLVEFEKDAKLSLLDIVGLELELSDLLGFKVDLVEKKTLKPYIGQRVLEEVVYV